MKNSLEKTLNDIGPDMEKYLNSFMGWMEIKDAILETIENCQLPQIEKMKSLGDDLSGLAESTDELILQLQKIKALNEEGEILADHKIWKNISSQTLQKIKDCDFYKDCFDRVKNGGKDKELSQRSLTKMDNISERDILFVWKNVIKKMTERIKFNADITKQHADLWKES